MCEVLFAGFKTEDLREALDRWPGWIESIDLLLVAGPYHHGWTMVPRTIVDKAMMRALVSKTCLLDPECEKFWSHLNNFYDRKSELKRRISLAVHRLQEEITRREGIEERCMGLLDTPALPVKSPEQVREEAFYAQLGPKPNWEKWKQRHYLNAPTTDEDNTHKWNVIRTQYLEIDDTYYTALNHLKIRWEHCDCGVVHRYNEHNAECHYGCASNLEKNQ